MIKAEENKESQIASRFWNSLFFTFLFFQSFKSFPGLELAAMLQALGQVSRRAARKVRLSAPYAWEDMEETEEGAKRELPKRAWLFVGGVGVRRCIQITRASLGSDEPSLTSFGPLELTVISAVSH